MEDVRGNDVIRHIEMIKISEVVDGKFRAEQLEELTSTLQGIISNAEGIVSHKLLTRSECHDPMDADALLVIDFESREALEEYDLDLDRVAIYMQIGEQSESILTYEYEI